MRLSWFAPDFSFTVLLLALPWWPGVALAQSAVRGVVSTPRGPLAGAQVFLDPGAASPILTDSSGRFLVPAGSGGRLRVHVRAIGYSPASRSLVLAPDDTIALDIELQPNVQELNPVVVEEERRDWVMEEFESRRRMGFGRFMTREVLAQLENSTVTNVMRRHAGVQYVRRPAGCGGGWAASSGRTGAGGGSRDVRCLNGNGSFPPACYLNVFLDGAPVYIQGNAEPPNLDSYNVFSLEAIEVYRSAAETPIQFQRYGNACGVLVLWTRRPG